MRRKVVQGYGASSVFQWLNKFPSSFRSFASGGYPTTINPPPLWGGGQGEGVFQTVSIWFNRVNISFRPFVSGGSSGGGAGASSPLGGLSIEAFIE